MPNKIILTMLLFVAVIFAASSEVVNYTNNWGKNPMFNVTSETDAGIEVVFSIHQMCIEENDIDGVPMKSYGIPGIFLANEEGAPNLAGTGRYIAIPQGATARATIVNSRIEIYHNVEVAPAPNIPLDNDASPLRHVKNMDIYAKDAYYPASPVRLSEKILLRGVDCVILGIMPFQYNPVTKELIVYKDLRVRIDFYGGNGHFGDDALRNIYWEPLLQGNLINYASLPQVDFFAPERIGGRDGYEYIIIVPDDPSFIAWGDTIKRWRKLQGISTEVYTLTQVGGNTTTAIENFLNNAYNTWNPRPVGFLLLSDYQSTGDVYGITSPIWNSYCVSDLIYADVNGDDLPDMFHGRITAQNESQLSVMVKKFLTYERTPPTDPTFYDQPIVCAAWQTDRWFQLCGEVVRGFMDTIHGLNKNPTRLYAINSGTPTPGCAWSSTTYGNTTAVVNYFYNLGWLSSTTNQNNSTWWSNGNNTLITQAINNGAFLLQHRDHGSETGWGEPAYSNSDISNLTNDELIFVNSHNCLTGKYNWTSECFTEKFHRWQVGGVPKGALGVNAASEVSYSFVNDCYVWGMYDCMWQKFMPDYPTSDVIPSSLLYPCAAMNYGKIFLSATTWLYSGIDPYRVYTYHLFHHHGDVFNPLYSEVPQNLTVTHMPTLIAGASSFTVSANDSAIIALTVNGEIIGAAQATGSPQAITIAPQIPGNNMIVTITKQNYYRCQVTVPVVSSSYPYVVATSPIVSDSGANSQVNPGERIDYGVWAKNIGIGTAQGIRAKLTTADAFTTIVTDSSWFGTIAANDSVYSNPMYRFRAARNTPNNHPINFTLTFKDINDSTFVSYRSVRVYAPILTYQNVVVLGGNNNGIFNRGETVNMVVTLENEGGAATENVTANLLVSNPHITMIDGQGSFGVILPNTTANNMSDQFTMCADTFILPGTMVQFTLAVNHSFYTDTFQFTIPIEIYFNGFENDNGNFEPEPFTGGWEWGLPTAGPSGAHTGTKVWATILGGMYTASANWKLVTPEFTATGDNPQLLFWHWYNTQANYDGGNLKISINEGPWTLIRPVGGYTGIANSATAGIPSESCYTGTGTNWTEVTFILPLVAGQRFKLCWHFGSNASTHNYGWYIDDVTGIGFATLPPPPNDVGVKAIMNPGAVSIPNTASTPVAKVKNFGLATQVNFPVVCSIVGPGGVFRYTNTQMVASLASGDSILVSFASWIPTVEEICTVKMRTNLTSDDNPTNDQKTGMTEVTSAINITIGTGTSGSTSYCMYGYYAYAASNAIYLQSEIGYYGPITHVAYYKTAGTSTVGFSDVRIFMRHTTETTVGTGGFDTTGFTRVYAGPFPFDAIGWMDVLLNTPFTYNNTDNLEVMIIKGPPAITTGYPSWQYTTQSPNYRNRYGYNASTIPTTSTRTYYRPNIRLSLRPSVPPARDVGVEVILAPPSVHMINTSMTPVARVKNFGSAAQTFPVVCSIIGPGYVVRYVNTQTVTNLTPGDTVCVNFTSWIPTIAEMDTVIVRTLLVNDSVALNDRKFGTTTIGIVMLQDFEASNGGYVADPASSAWEWGMPTTGPMAAHSGTKLWATLLGANYTASVNWKITTGNFVAMADNPMLQFWHWYDTEASYDGGNVKISTDHGANFTLITPIGGYSGTANSSNVGIPLEPCFTGHVQGYWEEETFVLPVDSGDMFMIRWHFGSDGSVYYPGWYIDDVVGFNFVWTSSIIEEPINTILKTMLYAPKPNPLSKGITNISFSIASPTNASLKIYDASGRLIKILVNSKLENGMYNYVWNSRDENNRAVAEGIYFYTLQTDDFRSTKKLILTR